MEINVASLCKKDDNIFNILQSWTNPISTLIQSPRFDGHVNGIMCGEICVEEMYCPDPSEYKS